MAKVLVTVCKSGENSPNLVTLLSILFFSGGKDGGDDEPDKMAIAFGRIGRFKAWVKNGVIGFFRGIKDRLLRLIRGGGNGRGNDIQLEVTEENDFQVIEILLLLLRLILLVNPKDCASLKFVCLKMGHPHPLFHLFSSFQTNIYNSYSK